MAILVSKSIKIVENLQEVIKMAKKLKCSVQNS